MNLADKYHAAILLYPSKMLYPCILPLVSMFDTFFKDTAAAQRKLKLFWIAFFWSVAQGTQVELNLLLFELMTASFSGRFSQSGCFLFLQDFRYFAWQIRGRRTSHESLEVQMEMKDLVYCRSA